MTPFDCPSDFPAWLSGMVFGSTMTLLLVGMFFAAGGRIWIERVWSGWSQHGGNGER